MVLNDDLTWTKGKIKWDGESRLDLNNGQPHLVTFVDTDTIDVLREKDGKKWTLTKTVPDEENEMME